MPAGFVKQYTLTVRPMPGGVRQEKPLLRRRFGICGRLEDAGGLERVGVRQQHAGSQLDVACGRPEKLRPPQVLRRE